MPKIIFHSKEYFYEWENRTSLRIKVVRKFKDGYILNYEQIWLPKNQIESKQKKYLTDREFLIIYKLPKWLIEAKDLWDFYYPDSRELKKHIDYLRKQR